MLYFCLVQCCLSPSTQRLPLSDWLIAALGKILEHQPGAIDATAGSMFVAQASQGCCCRRCT